MSTKFNVFFALAHHASSEVKCRLFNMKINLSKKREVFEGLIRYVNYRQYYQAKEQELVRMNAFNIKRSSFRKLLIFKTQSLLDEALTEKVRLMRCSRYIKEWRQALRIHYEEAEERRVANKVFMKFMFHRLRRISKIDKHSRRVKENLYQR